MTDKQYPYLVSVLMPAYNASLYIRQAIDSILSQTFSDFEFLIIDDGSTDNTIDIVKKYTDTRIKLIQNEQNRGLVYTLNKGLDIAQGKYIARMDADDICTSHRLEKQVAYMERHSGVTALSCAFRFMNTPHEIHFPTDSERIYIKLLDNTALLHPGAVLRSEVLRQENIRYNADYKHAEDYHLWVQFAEKGLELGNLGDVLVEYRQHEGQVSTTKQAEQDQIKDKIKLEFLSYFFKYFFSEQELQLVNKVDDTSFTEKVILINSLNKVNRKQKFFNPTLFEHYLKQLLYKNRKSAKNTGLKDFLKMFRKNVSFTFIITALKIKIKE